MRSRSFLGAVLLLSWAVAAEHPAAAEPGAVSDRFGAAVSLGTAYDPEGLPLALLSAVALFDYDRIWPHRAPDPLRFKVEASAGAQGPELRGALASVNMLALYYLDRFRSPRVRPFAEAGVGLLYSSYRVAGQGLHWNFNPQAGLGAELGRTGSWFAAVRLHHVSNGGLYRENRGVNSALLSVGRLF